MDSIDTMNAHSRTSSLGLHEPFLKRAADGSEKTDGDLGLGAFLTLRLADQFSVETNGSGRAAIEYQCSATRKFIEDIRPRSEYTSLLNEIIRVAEAALESNDRRLLFPPLLALACCLEDELSFDEGLDVVETALRLNDGHDGENEVAAFLQKARMLRSASRLAEARSAYDCAGAMALRLEDKHSELLSRVGCGIVARQVGNLPESEQILRKVIADSQACGDRNAEARGCQDLAGTLYFAGKIAEATPLAFQAFELFQSPLDKARALSDTGAMLKELGHYNAAKNAFSLVLLEQLPPDVQARTELECLEVSALIGDRLSFERWCHSVAEKSEKLPPDVQMDFELALGTGLSLFENHERAEAHFLRAITLAEQLGMAERIFYAERQQREAQDRRALHSPLPTIPASHGDRTLRVLETIERLEVLATSAQG